MQIISIFMPFPKTTIHYIFYVYLYYPLLRITPLISNQDFKILNINTHIEILSAFYFLNYDFTDLKYIT